MKKLLLFLTLFALTYFVQAQGYPLKQGVANNDSTLGIANAFQARAGLINGIYSDTVSANLTHMKQYVGGQIFTTSDNKFWLRNSTATAWILTGSGSFNSNVGTGFRLAKPNTNNIKTIGSDSTFRFDSSTTDILKLKATWWLNVKDYGAIGDGVTDNTNAFAACMDACVTAAASSSDGHCVFYIPAGTFLGKIRIPAYPGPKEISIEIRGESMPPFLYGTVTFNYTFPTGGSIIKSTQSNADSSVIQALPLAGSFSFINVYISDISVQTYDNPNLNGIDLRYAPFCNVSNVFINTGVYSNKAAQPTHGTAGLLMPVSNNGGMSLVRNVIISAYARGIDAYEHTDVDAINIYACLQAINLVYPFGPHAARFGRVELGGCRYGISCSDSRFSIEQFDIEHLDSATEVSLGKEWQITWADVYDPTNVGYGDINYWVIHAVNTDHTFLMNGGLQIRAKQVGSNWDKWTIGTDHPLNTHAGLDVEIPNLNYGITNAPFLVLRNTETTATENHALVDFFSGNGIVGGEIGTHYGSSAYAPYTVGGRGLYVNAFTDDNIYFATGASTTIKMTISNSNANVGIGTITPSSKAILDLTSTTKAFLPPRMTSAQRTAISSPVNGSIVFDLDTLSTFQYNGSAWQNLYNTGAGGGTPGGSDKQLQVNNAGAFGGISNGTTGQMLVSNGAGSFPSFQDQPSFTIQIGKLPSGDSIATARTAALLYLKTINLTVPSFLTNTKTITDTTLSYGVTLATQSANTVFAGPTSGGAATPTFRALVAADIPDLSGTYANKNLSNLSPTITINQPLIPQSGLDLGSTATAWRRLILYGSGTFGSTSMTFDGTPTSNRTITFPDASITVARTDAAQTFTGVQTFSSAPVLTGSSTTGYVWTATNSSGSGGWAAAAGGGLSGFTTFGSTPNNNGGSVSGANIILQPADATHPGGVSTSAQTFAGGKTSDTYFTAPMLYGGDMTTTHAGYVGAVLGGTAKHAVLDFVDNNTLIGELYTDAANVNFYTGTGSSFNFYVNNSFTNPAIAANSNGKVGINKAVPAQALDVAGNLQFSQALMPVGLAGSVGQVLFSAGAGVAPTWGAILSYAHTIFTPTTGGTVNLVNNQYNIINPAGALVALTVNLPSSPANNDVVFIKFTQTITTVTYGNGTVVDGITAPSAGGLTVLTYDSGTTSWY